MGKLVIRLVVFLSIVLAGVLILKWVANDKEENHIVYSDKLAAPTDTSLFFIGSSRVQRSIDPAIIKSYHNSFNVFNLGVSGGSFLGSCIMADFIIKQKGYKVLFIELSPMLEEIPETFFNMSETATIKPFRTALSINQNQPFSARIMLGLNILNRRLYGSVSIYQEVKEIADYKQIEEQWIGFYTSDINDSKNTSSFLTWTEINSGHSDYSIDLTRYRHAISYLQNLANENHTEIVFFLPIMCRKQGERSIVISLYNSLLDSSKLEFPADVMMEIAKGEFMMDQVHLNRKGATAYSRAVGRLIEEYFEKKKK